MGSHAKSHLYEFVTVLHETLFVMCFSLKHMTEFAYENICGLRKLRLAA